MGGTNVQGSLNIDFSKCNYNIIIIIITYIQFIFMGGTDVQGCLNIIEN
jgi:hypothetical protein